MLTEQQSKGFILFLEKYAAFYREFLKMEQDKSKAISKNDIESVNDFVKQEQAYMLKTKGLEVERDKITESYGMKDLTLREFLEHIHESKAERANELFNELTELLENLKRVNSSNNTMIELRLHRIGKALEQLEREGKPIPKKYDSAAQLGGKPLNIVSKKV